MNSNKMKQSTVLLVDDKPENLDVLLAYLHDAQLRMLVAQSGEEAIHITERFLPDLILLDVLMPPGIDGFETCRRLKASEKTAEIPIIFITALSDVNDKITGFQVGGVDYITKPLRHEEVLARVHTHLLLRRQRQQLEIENASKNKFFSIIAHDLRGPLHSIYELTKTNRELLERQDYEQVKKLLDLEYAATENLTKLLENLLTWARIQQGTIEFKPQMLNLGHLCRYAIDVLKPAALQKEITLTSDFSGDVFVVVDMNMLETVVRNLVSNAIKFTPIGGKITISMTQAKEMATVAVTDTGIGIDAAFLPQLFEIGAKFHRLGTAHEKGTGLGLILCKEFVERHGGSIQVDSAVNCGSTFSFTLPLPNDMAEAMNNNEYAGLIGGGDGR
ncbi:response regulator receiver sensor signal transduction histidine kinase [Candidatus Moduliflexus flocculans]|uniref:histidine kinase n=1 Tax=Candidatus Moduliflexus flocculans TaxID=1499966 RepID=A0A0S6W540_9BACT|nr:response regulator receiver sensor signal transduction histidine kinase [Candidatus Moduliflexus flocculans]